MAQLAGRLSQQKGGAPTGWDMEKGGGLTGGVLEDDTEDSDGTVELGTWGYRSRAAPSRWWLWWYKWQLCGSRGVTKSRKYSSSMSS